MFWPCGLDKLDGASLWAASSDARIGLTHLDLVCMMPGQTPHTRIGLHAVPT